ncbi:protein starmaker-like isoform X6 [Mytilus edulis]|uniref:protein starmaker-like isoform X6 n=1 Tax=Mytilus edulis TaxID=6550 RepID=UPI0039EE2CA8
MQTDVKVPSSEETGGEVKTDAGESKGRGNEDDSDTAGGNSKNEKENKVEQATYTKDDINDYEDSTKSPTNSNDTEKADQTENIIFANKAESSNKAIEVEQDKNGSDNDQTVTDNDTRLQQDETSGEKNNDVTKLEQNGADEQKTENVTLTQTRNEKKNNDVTKLEQNGADEQKTENVTLTQARNENNTNEDTASKSSDDLAGKTQLSTNENDNHSKTNDGNMNNDENKKMNSDEKPNPEVIDDEGAHKSSKSEDVNDTKRQTSSVQNLTASPEKENTTAVTSSESSKSKSSSKEHNTVQPEVFQEDEQETVKNKDDHYDSDDDDEIKNISHKTDDENDSENETKDLIYDENDKNDVKSHDSMTTSQNENSNKENDNVSYDKEKEEHNKENDDDQKTSARSETDQQPSARSENQKHVVIAPEVRITSAKDRENSTVSNKGKQSKSPKPQDTKYRGTPSPRQQTYRQKQDDRKFRRPIHSAPVKAQSPIYRQKSTDGRRCFSRASQSGKQKKEYKTEELRRLQEVLKKDKSHIRKPRQRAHFPFVWTSLEPYYNTSTAAFLIDLSVDDQDSKTPEPVETPRSPRTKKRNKVNADERQHAPVMRTRTISTPEEFRHSYVSRSTAVGLCDPWVDLEMDNTILPKIGSAQRTSTRGTTHSPERTKEQKKEKDAKEKGKKDNKGSTRLPKFPVVPFHAGKENATMRFPYQDIPKFREEMNQRFSLNAPQKIDKDYKRTKDDFYRMDLDKIEEIHPMNRPHMRKAYFAYLQNTPGSRKAVSECVKSLDESQKPQQQPTGSAQKAS